MIEMNTRRLTPVINIRERRKKGTNERPKVALLALCFAGRVGVWGLPFSVGSRAHMLI